MTYQVGTSYPNVHYISNLFSTVPYNMNYKKLVHMQAEIVHVPFHCPLRTSCVIHVHKACLLQNALLHVHVQQYHANNVKVQALTQLYK